LLARSGMQHQALAQAMGVRPATVSQWTNGHSLPANEKWDKLAELMECTPEDLFFGSGESSTENSQAIHEPRGNPYGRPSLKTAQPFKRIRGSAGYQVTREELEGEFKAYLDLAEVSGALPVAALAIRKHLDPRDFDYFDRDSKDPEQKEDQL
jgi:transcriptional regulator with XRE-family HTH domain